MRLPRLEAIASALVLLALFAGLERDVKTWRALMTPGPMREHIGEYPDRSAPIAVADTIPDVVDDIDARDVFNTDREGTADDASAAATPTPVKSVVRPALSLRGIVGGPPWSAIVDGVPRHQVPMVLWLSDTVEGLRVAAIRRDTVVIRGRDTTWTLSFPAR